MEINQYANEAFQINDEDFYDVDYWTGTEYQSRKISGATLKSLLSSGASGIFGISDNSGSYTYYMDLADALSDAVSGDVIKQFANYELTSAVALVPDVKINGNGYKITKGGSLFTMDINVSGKYEFIDVEFDGRAVGDPLIYVNELNTEILAHDSIFRGATSNLGLITYLDTTYGHTLKGGNFYNYDVNSNYSSCVYMPVSPFVLVYDRVNVIENVKAYSRAVNSSGIIADNCTITNCIVESNGIYGIGVYWYNTAIYIDNCTIEISDFAQWGTYGSIISNSKILIKNTSNSTAVFGLASNCFIDANTATIDATGVSGFAFNCVINRTGNSSFSFGVIGSAENCVIKAQLGISCNSYSFNNNILSSFECVEVTSSGIKISGSKLQMNANPMSAPPLVSVNDNTDAEIYNCEFFNNGQTAIYGIDTTTAATVKYASNVFSGNLIANVGAGITQGIVSVEDGQGNITA